MSSYAYFLGVAIVDILFYILKIYFPETFPDNCDELHDQNETIIALHWNYTRVVRRRNMGLGGRTIRREYISVLGILHKITKEATVHYFWLSRSLHLSSYRFTFFTSILLSHLTVISHRLLPFLLSLSHHLLSLTLAFACFWSLFPQQSEAVGCTLYQASSLYLAIIWVCGQMIYLWVKANRYFSHIILAVFDTHPQTCSSQNQGIHTLRILCRLSDRVQRIESKVSRRSKFPLVCLFRHPQHPCRFLLLSPPRPPRLTLTVVLACPRSRGIDRCTMGRKQRWELSMR